MDNLDYIKKECLKKGADDVVVEENSTNENLIKFVNNKIVNIQKIDSIDIGVFISTKKKIVMASIKDPKKEVIDKTINDIFSFSKFIESNNEYFGIASGPFKFKRIKDLYDKKIQNLNELGIKMVKDAIDNSKIKGIERSSGVMEWDTTKRRIVTSGNVDHNFLSTSIYFSIRSFADKLASGAQTCCSNVLKKLDYLETSKKAAEIAVLAKNPKRINQGRYDILLGYLPAANLLNHFVSNASAFEVKRGNSFFKGKIGKNVASQKLTISDEGNLANGYSSTEFDDEGMPTRKNIIVKKGILKTYLHNTNTAHLFKTKSTANAGLVSPKISNIVIESGNIKDQLSKIDNGLYVTNNWYTRFQNYLTGEFSTVPRDGIFLIKNGEIAGSIKEIRISDNLLRIMKNVVWLGKERKQVYSWEVETPTLTPEFFVKDVNITQSFR